jgi:tetratricopeptide (TPR) repeat protein
VAERLLEQGGGSADPADAVRQLQDALALWRGRPLADVADLVWVAAEAEHLDLLRMRIRQALSEARLAAGEHAQLVPELVQMVADYPLDERVHGQLMLALYRGGRQADALAVYHRLRHTLGEELGIDPSQALRDLETAILQQDPSLDVPTRKAALAAPATPVPAQLPASAPALIGRDAELARLDAIAAWAAGAGAAPPAAVVAISGTPGVGKTALALHWAHRVVGRFPDGQLYVNLRGFDPGGAALDPGQALHGFLDAFGVPATRIPEGLAGLSGLFRSVLAAVRLAGDMGLDVHCWQLAWILTTFLGRQGHWQDQVTALRTGLAAARRSNDAVGQAHILLGLGRGYARARQLHEADQHLGESQRLFDAIGGHFNLRANLHNGLAWLAEQRGRHDDTLCHSLRALELYRAGNQRVQILALNNVGYAHALLGNYEQALSCCERALAAGQEFGEDDWVKATLHSLGFIHHRLGDHRQAIAYYERSLELCRQLGDRYDEAEFLVHLGDVYDSAGDRTAARREWARALRIHDEIGHPGHDLLRAKLHDHNLAPGVAHR